MMKTKKHCQDCAAHHPALLLPIRMSTIFEICPVCWFIIDTILESVHKNPWLICVFILNDYVRLYTINKTLTAHHPYTLYTYTNDLLCITRSQKQINHQKPTIASPAISKYIINFWNLYIIYYSIEYSILVRACLRARPRALRVYAQPIVPWQKRLNALIHMYSQPPPPFPRI